VLVCRVFNTRQNTGSIAEWVVVFVAEENGWLGGVNDTMVHWNYKNFTGESCIEGMFFCT
jgi:hypothetical protein